MKTLALTQHIVDSQSTRKQIFRVLITLLVILCLGYVYLIGSMTFNILARRTLESAMRDTSSRVGGLEVEYLTLSNKVNLPSGSALGLVDPKGTTLFATRTSASTVAMR